MTRWFKDEPTGRADGDNDVSQRCGQCPHTPTANRPSRQARLRVASHLIMSLIGVALLIGVSQCFAPRAILASDYIDEFEGDTPTWQPFFQKNADARLRHRRNSELGRGGKTCEELQIIVNSGQTVVRFEHELPRSLPIDDLNFSVALRSNVPGIKVALRLVFPNQQHPDPSISQVLTAYLVGEKAYVDVGRWQTLNVKPTQRAMSERINRLRAQYKGQSLDLSGAYFDRAVILGDFAAGTTGVLIDDLAWTGYVSPQSREIVQTSAEESAPQTPSQVRMRHDRLIVEGRPSIIRFTPHHDEPIDRLQALGFNLIWVDDYSDSQRLQKLRDHGLWAMATPPRPPESGDNQGQMPALDPFDHKTDGVLLWYLATQVPGEARFEVDAQARRVRTADRQRQRPIIADIAGLERSYSRILDGVGLTRHSLQTELSLKGYRDVLLQKMKMLRPGTFTATWLQTEIETGPQTRIVPLIEPEQIRLQGYAALTAGCRGIGYWKRTALDAESVGSREREYAIAILNQEIELLEPWLSTRTVIDYQKVPLGKLAEDAPPLAERLKSQSTRLRIKSDTKKLTKSSSSGERFISSSDDEIEMAIVHCPEGMLVVPMWFQKNSQFVPGQMAARNVEIVIPSVPDTATVWELTTTRVRTLKQQPISSGVKIKLDNFDQVTALVVSTDPNWGRQIREKVDGMMERSAVLWLNLAKEKLERVRGIDAELQRMGVGTPESVGLLDRAQMLIRTGEGTFQKVAAARQSRTGGVTPVGYSTGLDFDSVRESATGALQSLRILQRLHWERAIENRPSPLFTPYSTCFQTLPDHWKFIERIGSGPVNDATNLLANGDFIQVDTAALFAKGWQQSRDEIETLQSAADVIQSTGEHGNCLRLLSLPKPNTDPPTYVDGTPISISTPAIAVRAGQIVHVSGSIRISIPPSATLDGVSLQESLTGSRLQWKQTRGWQRFEFVREVKVDSSLTLKFTHHGLGEVFFDDLRVVAYDNRAAVRR